MPEVYDPDPFEIVRVSTVSQVPDFPVRIIGVAGPGRALSMRHCRRSPHPTRPQIRGAYGYGVEFIKVLTADGRENLFEVTGGIASDGVVKDVDVHV